MIRVEINEKKTRKTIENLNKTKNFCLKRKIKLTFSQTKKKREDSDK